MELNLKLDGEVDLATGKLSGKGIGKKDFKPYHLRAAASAVAVAGVPTVLLFGSAPVGMLWNLLGLIVVGNDDHTVVAGATPAVYMGDTNNYGLTDLVQPCAPNFAAVPQFITWSDEVMWSHPSEDVFLVVTGAAAGQSLTAILIYDMWIGEEAQ